MRVDAEISRFQYQEAIQARLASTKVVGATNGALVAAPDDEKILVHDRTGWDRKTRAQLRDEAQARAVENGLSPKSPSANPQAQNSLLVNCDTAGCWGTDGTRYNGVGGNTMIRSDGRTCQFVAPGAPLQCN